MPDQKLKESIEITTSIEDCIKSIEEYFKAGFTKVYVHSTSPNETEFIREFGKKCCPILRNKLKRIGEPSQTLHLTPSHPLIPFLLILKTLN